MATQFPFPQTTPVLLLILLLLSIPTSPIFGINITSLLSPFPDLSDFSSLLSSTGVATDLLHRSAVTILAIPNSLLRSSPDLPPHPSPTTPPPPNLVDILRCHVMLEYLSLPDLHHFPPEGKLVTTLFQSTGRASGTSGYVNVTAINSPSVNSGDDVKTVYIHTFVSNVTVLSLVKMVPYNVSIFSVSGVLVPYNFDIMSSETRPPLGVNITKVLLDGHNFNVAASMLMASGVEVEFEQDQGGAGITLFVPTDDAFSDLPGSVKFQSLPADEKADVLRFHVLHSYYPLGSLESIVNPVQPTLATEKIGAGRFTLNISKINGSVAIDTGIIQASVTRTVFDQNPVAIFGVSKVLLPGEMFGKNPIGVSKGGGRGGIIAAQPPAKAFTPDNHGEVYGPSSHLTSPPGLSDDVASKVGRTGGELKIISLMVFVYSFWFLLLLRD